MDPRKLLICIFWVLLFSPCYLSLSDGSFELNNENLDDEEEDEDISNEKDFEDLIQELEMRLQMRLDERRAAQRKKALARRKEENNKLHFRKCTTAECVAEYLEYHNKTATSFGHGSALAEWNNSVNMTKANAKQVTATSLIETKWDLDQLLYIRKLRKRSIPGLSDQQKRLLLKNSITASSFDIATRRLLHQTMNSMSSIYAHARVEVGGKKLQQGEAGPVAFFRKSRNCRDLTSVWKKWRDVSGKKLKTKFTEMVNLLNIGARENGFSDYGHYEWLTDFEVPNFNELVMNLYSKISPLYKELHAYVRHKLHSVYPDCVDRNGSIPAQLLGNVWAQQWTNIFDLVKPYPEAASPDVTKSLVQQGWTVHKMFKAAEEFFVSIGLFKMTKTFWQKSMLTEPKGRTVDCHGSADDLFKWKDFRIKMCTTVNENDFTTVHHEMGHITYFMSYENQPYTFRTGANSGFHEAIGDTIALSASTMKHLQQMNLTKSSEHSREADINTLMKKALEKVAFLPFGLLIDTWRWRVFNGTITKDHYNKEWWKLRHDLQGLKPPVKRTEDDFDPGAKYHVAENVPYIRYFVSFIIQFQFYEAMCKASGHTGPLYKCDFYKSPEAGALLKSMLSLGMSKPWPDAMKVMTKQSSILLGSVERYFKPLQDWMQKYRKENGYPLGWPKQFNW